MVGLALLGDIAQATRAAIFFRDLECFDYCNDCYSMIQKSATPTLYFVVELKISN